MSDFRVPPIYQRIAAEPGDFTLLELPTGWRNGARVMGKSDVLIMMQQRYQTVHEKRRIGGNTSRNPAYKFDYFSQAPLLGDLISLMNADAPGPDGSPYLESAIREEWESIVVRNRAVAAQVLSFLQARYVTLHMEKASPWLIRFVEEVLPLTLVDEWSGSDWQGAPATIRLYATDLLPQADWAVQLGAPQARIHLAEGWMSVGIGDGVRMSKRTRAPLLLHLPPGGGTLRLWIYGPARLQALTLNRRSLEWTGDTDEEGAQVIEVSVPSGLAEPGVDRLTLHFDGLYSAVGTLSRAEQGYAIGGTGTVLPADRPLLVMSAGIDRGDYAHIYVAGEERSPGARGYNLAALDRSGRVLAIAAFDTLASTESSLQMADWIRSWPPGTIVAGAVRDEASLNLEAQAIHALRSVGVAGDLRGRFRASHAFVGVVGAPAGTAVEATSSLGPVHVSVGPPLDGLMVSGGVGRIEIRAGQMDP